ncbi:related to Double-strand-break repair protein rad21 [Melanopsichium pennsylvanicum]|uniref:Related to Double-strand-break repair protein rad21 n=2 Tax=Melanopsichium pennsylvanicum TaxID=63383 RepID=A0AAJ4XLF9_9BASI|nr:related to Double-strand-break repair protein rad21 [Melanopsichium pennsylvanicum 4]SNX84303.1 related to Double-strand-break repair protein rad21 [Melanopsichium pennsylvanicum]
MFYSDVILAKRGPLARVWLAAHWERKLSKTQFLQTSIEKSVSAIMGQEVVPMALRLSGQLLLGVVRIYSRKAKYLLEDCNEALLKIKMAFRSGAVDMTSDQLHISRNAITLPDIRTDLDILLPDQAMNDFDIDFEKLAAKKAKKLADNPTAYTARAADITLPTVDYSAFDDTFDISSGIEGIASQDFDPDGGLDLGLEDDLPEVEGLRNDAGQPVDENGDPIREDDSLSIGVGRDAPSEAGRQSVASMLNLGMDNDITLGSVGGSQVAPSVGMPDFDLSGDGLDLGLDLGLDAPMDIDRAVTPPPGDNSMALAMADMTPTTAARIRDAAQQRAQDAAATRQAKARKQIVDTHTELPDTQLGGLSQGPSQGAVGQAANLSDILTEERYLPRSRAYLRLLTIREDPFTHFMPFADPSNKDKSSQFIGPTGLVSELSEMFTFDLGAMRRRRAAALTEEERSNKRARLGEDEDEMGVARHAEGRESIGFGDLDVDQSGFDFGMGDDGGFDVPELYNTEGGLDLGEDGLRRSSRKSRAELEADADGDITGRLPALSRLSTPEADDAAFDSLAISSENPLAIFDVRPVEESQLAPEEAASALRASEEAEASTKGWAKSTVRALRVVRSQLSPQSAEEASPSQPSFAQPSFVEVDEEKGEKKLSFAKISTNASRRAAAGFFFEMLVLGTKDCVKLCQDEAYGDIKIGGKPKLWNASAPTSTQVTQAEVLLPDAQTAM